MSVKEIANTKLALAKLQALENLSLKDYLLSRRAELGLTQAEVANHLGISRTSYISRERNPDTLRLPEIRKLAEILDTNFFFDFMGKKS